MSYTTNTSASFALTVGQSVAVRTQLNEGAKVRIQGASADREYMVNDANSKTIGPFAEAKTVTVSALYGTVEYDYGTAPSLPAFVYTSAQTESSAPSNLALGYQPATTPALDATSQQVLANSGVGSSAAPMVRLPSNFASLASAIPIASKALKAAKSGTHTIAGVWKNSTGVGYGASGVNYVNAKRYNVATMLAKHLRTLGVNATTDSQIGDNLVGTIADLMTYNPRITATGWTATLPNGLGGNALQSLTGNATAYSLQCSEPCDTAILFYTTSGGALGGLSADIGGGVLATAVGNQALATRSLVIPLGALGLHKINIKNANTGLDSAWLNGLIAYDSQKPGVSVVNLGEAGMRSSRFSDTSNIWFANPQLSVYAAAGMSLVVMGEGINDWTNGVSAATRTANFTAGIAAIKAAGMDAVIVTDPSSTNGSTPFATQKAFYAADVAQGVASAVPVIDTTSVLGMNDGSTFGNSVYVDSLGHLTGQVGYPLYGSSIGAGLTTAVN
jgi:hypothetical protein